MSARTARERVIMVNGYPFIQLKGGRMVSFWDMMGAAERAQTDLSRAASRAFKLAAASLDPEMRGYHLEYVESLIESLEDYASAVRHALEGERGVKTKQERIALLRNVTGRTPEEAAEFRRKADQLEAALREQAG